MPYTGVVAAIIVLGAIIVVALAQWTGVLVGSIFVLMAMPFLVAAALVLYRRYRERQLQRWASDQDPWLMPDFTDEEADTRTAQMLKHPRRFTAQERREMIAFLAGKRAAEKRREAAQA